MTLAQKQTMEKKKSMEQKRELTNDFTHLWSIDLQQKRQEYTMSKRQSLQKVVFRKLENIMCKYEITKFLHIK